MPVTKIEKPINLTPAERKKQKFLDRAPLVEHKRGWPNSQNHPERLGDPSTPQVVQRQFRKSAWKLSDKEWEKEKKKAKVKE